MTSFSALLWLHGYKKIFLQNPSSRLERQDYMITQIMIYGHKYTLFLHKHWYCHSKHQECKKSYSEMVASSWCSSRTWSCESAHLLKPTTNFTTFCRALMFNICILVDLLLLNQAVEGSLEKDWLVGGGTGSLENKQYLGPNLFQYVAYQIVQTCWSHIVPICFPKCYQYAGPNLYQYDGPKVYQYLGINLNQYVVYQIVKTCWS